MKVEGFSFSELLLEALKEYIEVHYPGNPQLTLPSISDPTSEKPLRLETKFAAQELESLIEILEKKQGSLPFRRDLENRVKQLLVKLAKMNQRFKDQKVNDLIEKAERGLETEWKLDASESGK